MPWFRVKVNRTSPEFTYINVEAEDKNAVFRGELGILDRLDEEFYDDESRAITHKISDVEPIEEPDLDEGVYHVKGSGLGAAPEVTKDDDPITGDGD